MRRAVRIATLVATLGTLTFATPGFAFDVQSGGVSLSPQSVALLANRLAARNDAGQPGGQPGRAGQPAGATTAAQGPMQGAKASAQGAMGPADATLTRDERMMRFMFGGQTAARPNAAADGLADAVKAALRNRR